MELKIKRIFFLGLTVGFFIALLGCMAQAQIINGSNSTVVSLGLDGQVREVRVQDPRIDYIVFDTTNIALDSSVPVSVELLGPPLKAVLEITSNGGQPWYAEFVQNGRATKILTLTSQMKKALRIEQLKRTFPGLTLAEIVSFFGLPIDQVLKLLFPEELPLDHGVLNNGIISADSCDVLNEYHLRLIISLHDLSDRVMNRGVIVRAGLRVGFPTSPQPQLLGRRFAFDRGARLVNVRVPSDKNNLFRFVSWDNGAPSVSKPLRIKRYFHRRGALYAQVNVQDRDTGTVQWLGRDYTATQSACMVVQ